MLKKTGIFALALGVMLPATFAFAEDSTTTNDGEMPMPTTAMPTLYKGAPTPMPPRDVEGRVRVMNTTGGLREGLDTAIEHASGTPAGDVLERLRERTSSTLPLPMPPPRILSSSTLMMHPEIQARIEEGKARLQEAQDHAKQVMEENKAHVQEFQAKAKERVAEIKDQVKQKFAQNLGDQFGKIDKVETDHFTAVLTQLTNILQKVSDRAATAASNGQDITAVTAAVQAAKDAIAVAQTAVAAQAEKTYVLDTTSVSVTTDATTTDAGQQALISGLRQSFQDMHAELKSDLTDIRDGVMKDARAAVQAAIKELGKLSPATAATTTSTN